MSEDEKIPGMSVVDALVYAPLGFVLDLPAQLPKWTERGRNQVGVARMIGTFALKGAPAGSDKLSSSLRRGFGLDVADGVELPMPVDEVDYRSEPEDAAPEPGPDPASLAIAEYESLAAAHVLPRLEGLEPEELADVAAFEQANRRRRTVLHRIEQLLDGAD